MEISCFTLSAPRSPLFLPFQSSQSTFLSSNGTTSLSFSKTSVNGSALVMSKSRTRTERAQKGMMCNALFSLGMPEFVVIAGVEALQTGYKGAGPKERPRLRLIVCDSTRGNTNTPAELGSSAAHNAGTP
ncbi:hypothetical protein DVH24_025425 [Malus domestica]|uniref:Uncharacterized protein n=1 Tax=Malus domestica TaxID=3750 RepID=A0A498HNQ3_MALDO|nr:hypothetical protein DVH24_025425 [Malus domestica]